MDGGRLDVTGSRRAWQCAAEYQRARQFLELPVTVQVRQGRRDARAFCRQHDLRRWRTGRCREDEAFQPAVPAQRICQHIGLLRRGARPLFLPPASRADDAARHGRQRHRSARPWGMTVSAFAPVCMKPPTLLVCVNEATVTAEHIQRDRRFCVNLLSERQIAVSQLCSRGNAPKFIDEAFLERTALPGGRSEEHTSELQSLMRISYAVFCLKKKKHIYTTII